MAAMRARLQQARINKSVTQKEVAIYLGMVHKAYQAIELGTRGTSENNWLKLFEYFNREIPLHELMEKTERKKI